MFGFVTQSDRSDFNMTTTVTIGMKSSFSDICRVPIRRSCRQVTYGNQKQSYYEKH